MKSHPFPPEKEKGEPERAGSLCGHSFWTHSYHQTLTGTQGAEDAHVPHDGDTILGVHKAGRPASAFSAPDSCCLEEGAGLAAWLTAVIILYGAVFPPGARAACTPGHARCSSPVLSASCSPGT